MTPSRALNPIFLTGDPNGAITPLRQSEAAELAEIGGVVFRYHTNRHYYSSSSPVATAPSGAAPAARKRFRLRQWRELGNAASSPTTRGAITR